MSVNRLERIVCYGFGQILILLGAGVVYRLPPAEPAARAPGVFAEAEQEAMRVPVATARAEVEASLAASDPFATRTAIEVFQLAKRAGLSPRDIAERAAHKKAWIRLVTDLGQAEATADAERLRAALEEKIGRSPDMIALQAVSELFQARDAASVLDKVGHVQACLRLIDEAVTKAPERHAPRFYRLIIQSKLPSAFSSQDAVAEDVAFFAAAYQERRALERADGKDGPLTRDDVQSIMTLAQAVLDATDDELRALASLLEKGA